MSQAPALLCLVNFPSNTGFAWNFLEGLYARLAARLAPGGIRTLVAYPRIDDPPATLRDSPAEAVELDASLTSAASRRATAAVIRREQVKVVLGIDRPPRHWTYAGLRAAGALRLFVYDQGSGYRDPGSLLKRPLKWLYPRIPGLAVDRLIAVSDFVAGEQRRAWFTPAGKIVRIWNGMNVPAAVPAPGQAIHGELGLDPGRPLVVCSCRAVRAKGVITLLEAFDRMLAAPPAGPRPFLVYAGDGPDLPEFREVHARLTHQADIRLLGKRSDVPALLRDAALAVVPSVWQEGFGLAALEPMAAGRAVIASRAGALPEIVRDGETGLLVPPADVPALAGALAGLLSDAATRDRLGQAGHARARAEFSLDRQVDQLTALVREGFPA